MARHNHAIAFQCFVLTLFKAAFEKHVRHLNRVPKRSHSVRWLRISVLHQKRIKCRNIAP